MAQVVERKCGSVRWHIDPDFVADAALATSGLLDPDGPCVQEWLQTGQATLVKYGPHQSVYHVVLPDLDFYLKHYRVADTRAWLRSLVRPAKARLEFERTRTAAERGLPTLTPLAAGEALAGDGTRSSYLVTRTLTDAVPLNRFLESTLSEHSPGRQTRLRQRIAVVLGQLLARMHQAGVTYRDLHPGNLLLQLDAEDRPRLFLIDVYDVAFGPPLSPRESRDNLIILNRWFMLRSERTDRLRGWRAYQEARDRLPYSQRLACPGVDVQGTSDLERATLISNLRFWRNLDRRCLETNRHFRVVRSGAVVGHAVTNLESDLLARLLANPDELFRGPATKCLKDSPSSTVIELPAPTSGGKALILKRFAVTRWSDPWVSLVRHTPALRSFVYGHGLGLRWLPTPRPLAVLHRQRHGLRYEGYLLTEKVEHAIDLVTFVERMASDRNGLRRLIALVAKVVCTLHQRRLSHRDLKAPNLLVRTDPETLTVSLWFIDLVGVLRHRRLPKSRRVQNLARLHTSFHAHPLVTRTDKLRFLRTYLRWGLHGKQGWKSWWRQIDAATRAKIARNLRNRRPLG